MIHPDIQRAALEMQRDIDRESNFRLLVETYDRTLVGFFRKRGFSYESARDLTRETFLGVYAGVSDFRAEARFDTWLFQIAANTCRKALSPEQTQKRGAGFEVEPVVESEQLDRLLGPEAKQRVAWAIEQLPTRMRACLALEVHQELSHREIALVMQISVETVRASIHRARIRLRSALAAESMGKERAS